MKNHKSALTFSITFLICCALVSAQENYLDIGEVGKTHRVGENITVNYTITNPTNEKKTFHCVLTFDPPTAKQPFCRTQDITLEPGQTYTGSISELAEVSVDLSKVKIVLTDEKDKVIDERTMDMKIVPEGTPYCGDGACGNGDNFLTCPQDCPSGSKDGYCDTIQDDKCDPDCNRTQDKDCTCNLDGTCENGIEDYMNCQQDCPSGSKDGYCDTIQDGKCDPDCNRTQDSDCTCNKDGVCENGFESYQNCQQDCPSGSKDGYCDAIKDGICDPDCETGQDTDCVTDAWFISYLPYAGVFIVILIIAAVILMRRKNDDKKIEKEREEFMKWKEQRGG